MLAYAIVRYIALAVDRSKQMPNENGKNRQKKERKLFSVALFSVECTIRNHVPTRRAHGIRLSLSEDGVVVVVMVYF